MVRSMPRLLLLYDGHCLLCNRFIQKIVARDKSDDIRVAALQDFEKIDHQIALKKGIDSVILVEKDAIFYKSTAALRILSVVSSMGWWYRLLLFVPRFIRDFVYDVIAANRYKWFGRSDECVLPTDSFRAKYLKNFEELHRYIKNRP